MDAETSRDEDAAWEPGGGAPLPVSPQVPPCCTGCRLAPRSLCLPEGNRGASSMCWLPHPLTEGGPTPGLTPLQRQKKGEGGRERERESCWCRAEASNKNILEVQLHRRSHNTPRHRTHVTCTAYLKFPTLFFASHTHSNQAGHLCSDVFLHKLKNPLNHS